MLNYSEIANQSDWLKHQDLNYILLSFAVSAGL